jgi:hypothetical protein
MDYYITMLLSWAGSVKSLTTTHYDISPALIMFMCAVFMYVQTSQQWESSKWLTQSKLWSFRGDWIPEDPLGLTAARLP